MVASLQGLREDVEHARCVAACGVVAVLLLVALNDICAPRPVNCEVHPGQAPLSFPAAVDYQLALEGDAGSHEEARHTLLLLLLTLLATGGMLGAHLPIQDPFYFELRSAAWMVALVRPFIHMDPHMVIQCTFLCKLRSAAWMLALVRLFTHMDPLVESECAGTLAAHAAARVVADNWLNI